VKQIPFRFFSLLRRFVDAFVIDLASAFTPAMIGHNKSPQSGELVEKRPSSPKISERTQGQGSAGRRDAQCITHRL
jgi:hypothetical protein